MSGGPEEPLVRGPPARLELGERFELALRANPTTGYSWVLTVPPELALIEESHERDSDLVGAGGVKTFRFEGARCGPARLVALYRRPWEPGAPRRLAWTIEVVVAGRADLGSVALGAAP